MIDHILTLLIAFPILGAILVALLPATYTSHYKWVALSALLLDFALIVFLYLSYNSTDPGLQFAENVDWITVPIGSLGVISIDYALAIDGISFPLIILGIVVLLAGVVSSWNMVIKSKAYFALYLILSASILGCFLAQDFFLFYLFFEFMLLPMYFLIGLWGGPRREYAALKFFIYTFLGSLLILIVNKKPSI